jgi:hypothetical protein
VLPKEANNGFADTGSATGDKCYLAFQPFESEKEND